MSNRIEGNLYVAGSLSCTSMGIPPATVDDAAVEPAAGIAASKLEHRYKAGYSQAIAAAATTGSYVIHSFSATGGVEAFKAACATKPAGDATVTLNLLNGTSSILTAAVTLNSSSTNYTFQAGTISTSACTAGNVLVLSIAASTGTGGTLANGLFAYADVVEDYA